MSVQTKQEDLLDEFLDRRLYDDPAFQRLPPAQHQNSGHSQNNHSQRQQPATDATMADLRTDDDMFSAFLTDEINKNDFLVFSAGTPDSHMLGVDGFHIPDDPLSLVPDVPTPQSNASNGTQNQFMAPPQQQQQQHQPPAFQGPSHHTTPGSVGLTPPQQHEVFTTPTGTFPMTGRSDSMGFDSSHMVSPYDSSYESARSLLSQLKFGRESPAQFHNEFPKELVSIDPSSLPYQLRVENLPMYSRVETQIKLQLTISPPPPQFLIHLPADTIAKQKLCLSSDLGPTAREGMLFLDTYVITSSEDKPCNICSRCVRREQKRASRRKSGVSDNLNWMTNANKRAIIFNCKEVISFPAMPASNNSKSVEISSRIVCYCRHHNESKGFKLLVVLKNANGQVVAKHISSPIMIMDRKKNNEDGATGVNTASNSANEASTAGSLVNTAQPISPASFEDDSSEPQTSDSRVFKRKRTWSPELSDGFSIAPSRKPSNTLKKEPISPQSQVGVLDTIQPPLALSRPQQNQPPQPMIQRVIPAQGPLRGGIEVTLLGSNFKQGLIVKFGVNKALSTQCWSESTMVTYLPPSSQPGQVVVSIEDPSNLASSSTSPKTGTAIFTYLDDTDRQMIELALQIVGLKMNGKLEDARNIARKIIGSDGSGGSETQVSGLLPDSVDSYSLGAPTSDEDLVLKVINRLPTKPNWAICTAEGQTLLHLSALKGYSKVVSALLQKGARVDYRDVSGYTPLHYASLSGDRSSIEMLLSCRAKVDAKTDDGLTPEDVADSNVLDLFRVNSSMSRKMSNSSFSSSIFSLDQSDDFEIQGGLHVSRLTFDHLTDGNDTDAFRSDSDGEASNEESESDWDDDRDESSLDEIRPSSQSLAVTPAGTTLNQPSLWNKMRNVFTNSSDQEQLPKYDELFPIGGRPFSLAKFRSPFTLTSTTEPEADSDAGSSVQNEAATNSSDEGDDMFMKFFQQRKNVQNDKMLLFFWLPLLLVIMAWFVLSNFGYTPDYSDEFQEMARRAIGHVMLGNERVKVALNKHFNQMNEAMTSVINAS